MEAEQQNMRRALQAIAPGTELRDGLERIKRSQTGALIILGQTPEVEAICSGGFTLDVGFSASRLRELAKMDGAIIVDPDDWRIRKANVHLVPDPTIPTDESGTRHRTAQRTARQANVPVLSLSASMRMISVYVGNLRRIVEEPEALLSRTNQAVGTLERYIQRLDEVLASLAIFEMRESVTIRDLSTVVQRMEMVRRISTEINGYFDQLGEEGRLLALQVDDLLRGTSSERSLVLRDYVADPSQVSEVERRLAALSDESLVDLATIAQTLGLPVVEAADLDEPIEPRGIRALAVIPRLPWRLIMQISNRWPSLSELRSATIEDLQDIEGVGPHRAQTIVDHLLQRASYALDPNFSW